MKKEKLTMEFDIWNFIDIDDINDMVDDTLSEQENENNKIATELEYKFISIDKKGKVKVEVKYIYE